MRKIIATIAIALSLTGCDTLHEVAKNLPDYTPTSGGGLTTAEVVSGLKTALSVGTDTAVGRLMKPNGYFNDAMVKILLPPEAKPIFDNLSKIPGGQELVNKTIAAINRAAEDAAVEAKPIFKDAITGITINDAMGILKSHDSAATVYLKGNTYNPLKNAFSPKINNSLDKPLVYNISAAQLYKNLVDAYNTVAKFSSSMKPIQQNTLGDYVTTKALDGLFTKVAKEEREIRKDPVHRVTDILRKVFSQK